MVIFALSFILIFLSSYFIAAILENKNSVKGFIYTFLIAFAQIVLTSEVLSLFKQIKVFPFISSNIIFVIITTIVWIKFGKPTWKFELKNFKNKFFNSLKLDKSLWILFLCWSFFILVSIYLAIILPVTSYDSKSYHVARCIDWIVNNSIVHFDCENARNIEFPINSSLLYLWVILFTKKLVFLNFFSVVSYMLSIVSLYNIINLFGYSFRKNLWVLFVISSLPATLGYVTGTENGLIISGLVLSSIYLFLDSLKNKTDNKAIYISSLAYALAFGVKTTAFICFPAILLLFIIYSIKYKDRISLIKFLIFTTLNFCIFSSYNYVLNFIDYGNFLGSAGVLATHRNNWGIKGFFANFIKQCYLLIDFSGVDVPFKIRDILYNLETQTLKTFHLIDVPIGMYSGREYFNITIVETYMGSGILGIMLIIPYFFISIFQFIFNRKEKNRLPFLFSLIFLICICSMSALIAFMTFNVRFLGCFMLICTPMILNSYIRSNKNVIKIIYILIMVYSFLYIGTHIKTRNIFFILNAQTKYNITQVRYNIYNKTDEKKGIDWRNVDAIFDNIYKDKNTKVLFLPNSPTPFLYTKLKKLKGYNYDFRTIDSINSKDFDLYDIIVVPKLKQDILIGKFDKEQFKNNLKKDGEILVMYRYFYINKNKKIPYLKSCSFSKNFLDNHKYKIEYQTNSYYILTRDRTKNKGKI